MSAIDSKRLTSTEKKMSNIFLFRGKKEKREMRE